MGEDARIMETTREASATEGLPSLMDVAKKMAQTPGAIYAGRVMNCRDAKDVTGDHPPHVVEKQAKASATGERLLTGREVLTKMGYSEDDIKGFLRERDRLTGLKVDSCEPGVWPNTEDSPKEVLLHERVREVKQLAKEAEKTCTCGPNEACSECPDRGFLGRKRYDAATCMAHRALAQKDDVEEDIKAYLRSEEMAGEPAYEALLVEVQRRFKGLKLSWRNGKMYVGEAPTKIGVSKVGWAYRELRGLGTEQKVREVVADMIASKLSEVFEPASGYFWGN